MWNDHALKSGVVEVTCVGAFHDAGAVAPVLVDRKYKPAQGWIFLALRAGKSGAGDGRARDEPTGTLEKVASVHGFPREVPSRDDRGVHYLTLGCNCKRLHVRVGRTRPARAHFDVLLVLFCFHDRAAPSHGKGQGLKIKFKGGGQSVRASYSGDT